MPSQQYKTRKKIDLQIFIAPNQCISVSWQRPTEFCGCICSSQSKPTLFNLLSTAGATIATYILQTPSRLSISTVHFHFQNSSTSVSSSDLLALPVLPCSPSVRFNLPYIPDYLQSRWKVSVFSTQNPYFPYRWEPNGPSLERMMLIPAVTVA